MANVRVTDRVRTIEYAIRDVIAPAKQVAKTGKKIYYLNIGDPVAFDFKTPPHIRQALVKAVEEGANYYAPSEGLPELRQAISRKEKNINGIDISPENIVVTNGISEGIQMVMAALINPSDEVLLPGPTYPPYISYTKFFGGKPVTYRTVEQEGWQPNIEDLRKKISDKTRAIVIISPNNPTGALYDEKVVKQILDLAAEHNLLVISDEIYDQIVFDEQFVSTSRLATDQPIVGLNGFSKAHLMTGWRLGYVYVHDQAGELTEFKECIEKESRIRLCANTPVQKAGIAALDGPQDHVRDMCERLKQRRDYTLKRLNEMVGVTCAKPEAAFYVFPKIEAVGSVWKSDWDFIMDLLRETGVLLVHGSGFDPIYGSGHVRGVILPPIDALAEALDVMERFMEKRLH